MMHGGTEAGKLFNWTSEQGGKRNQFGNIIAEIKTCLRWETTLDKLSKTATETTRTTEAPISRTSETAAAKLLMDDGTTKTFWGNAHTQSRNRKKWHQIKIGPDERMGYKLKTKEGAQSVKLKGYTITKPNGDYKDLLHSWSQFTVKVHGSSLSEISKFSYLLKQVEGKPKEDILAHNVKGYK